MADQKNEKGKSLKLNIGDSQIELPMDSEGNISMPEELKQIIAAGMTVLNQANEANKAGEPNEDANTADAFRGLPMSELIGAPLFAAADAQQRLAGIAWDFYQKIAFDKTDGISKKTRVLEFEVERPIIEDGAAGKLQKQKVTAPFIGLVPIPSLLIDRVDVDFQMEVTDTNVSKSNVSSETSASASSKWFGITASVSGKVSTSRENTRTTNQTAKYQVHVTASQQKPTEGLSKLMDIMASCIEPVGNNSGGK